MKVPRIGASAKALKVASTMFGLSNSAIFQTCRGNPRYLWLVGRARRYAMELMADAGMNNAQIAKVFDCDQSTVYHHIGARRDRTRRAIERNKNRLSRSLPPDGPMPLRR